MVTTVTGHPLVTVQPLESQKLPVLCTCHKLYTQKPFPRDTLIYW